MKTTLLNPTVWLLAGTFVSAVWGAIRRQDARASFDRVGRVAISVPVLAILVLLAGGGVASRAVLGFLSPGAYAEEVVAARAFIDDRQLYGATAERTSQWVADATTPIPWGAMPGVSTCHADALEQRALFYTSQAHTPMLLMAGVPMVRLAGGRGVYVTLLIASALAIVAVWGALVHLTGLSTLSRGAVLIAAGIAGWQPVLAAIKQGDAVLPVAGLVAVAWHLARRAERQMLAGLAAGAAAAFALPAAGVVPALLCCRRRAGWGAVAVVGLAVALVATLAGWPTLTTFVAIAVDTGRVYLPALTNYAIAPRLAALHVLPVLGVLLLCAVAAFTWAPLREPDRAFALFLPLGMAMSPLLWSQHLVLMLVPLTILLARLLRTGSSVALAAWALLSLLLSLPDTTAAAFSGVVSWQGSLVNVSAVSAAFAVLWIWSATSSTVAVSALPRHAPADAAGAASVS